jgi:aryl-alcohol dehydrogenase-like predicted oxidoreductase
MERRTLRSLGRNCAVLAFGTWPIGGVSTFGGRTSGLGPADATEARRALARAYELGINFYDCADTYGNGRAEELLGETLSKTDAIFCTKLGNREIGGRAVKDFLPAWIETCVTASMRRLRRDWIDILLLHSPPDDYDWSAFDSAPLQRMVEQGVIRSWGVSCRSFRGAERVIDAMIGSVVEVIYNALDRRIEGNVLPHAQQRGIDVLARVPLASGFLAAPRATHGADDIRSTLSDDDRAWRIEMAMRLQSVFETEGGLAAGALRFALSEPAIAAVIAGMRTVRHVELNVAAAERGPLSATACARVRTAVPEVFCGWS